MARSGSSEAGVESGRQTPAAPPVESESAMRQDVGADVEEHGEVRQAEGDVSMAEQEMEVDAEHRRSDHERQAEEAQDILPPLPGSTSLYKLSTSRK